MDKIIQIKSQKRVKELGEVYTPPVLVREILNLWPQSVWSNKEEILENACGNGNMIVEIVKKKLETGCTPLEALATTKGVDIMHDNVEECQLRLQKVVVDLLDKNDFFEACKIISNNIRVGNSLQQSLEEIFSPLPGAQNVMQEYED